MRSAGLIGERAAFMRGLVADMAARWSPNDVRLILAGAESLTTGSFLYRNLRGEIPPRRGEVTTHESHIL